MMYMDKIQALHSFWSNFDLKAYEENSVPDDLEMPYITYEVQSGSFYDGNIALSASLWYHSSSWASITQKADEISKFISMSGRLIECDDGCLWVKRRSPFAQNLVDDTDDKVKRIIISVSVEFLTEN